MEPEQNRTEQICLFGVLYKDGTSSLRLCQRGRGGGGLGQWGSGGLPYIKVRVLVGDFEKNAFEVPRHGLKFNPLL